MSRFPRERMRNITSLRLARVKMSGLDLVYRLTENLDLTISLWAFSGFCLRVRKDGDLRISSPDGVALLPNPIHTKSESDWPDAPWYAREQTLTDGARIGAAVMSYPSNPPTLWHNHRGVRLLNPRIVAPGALKLAAGKPLVLRYRVETFDGAVPASQLNALAGGS